MLLAFMGLCTGVQAAQQLTGHVPDAAKSLRPVGRLESARRMNLAVGLPLRNREALTNLLRDLYDPASPQFHHYLTAADFAARFGPTAQDYQTLVQHARAHGLTIAATHPNNVILDVSGSVADVEKWLHVHMQVYRHPTEARTFFAPDAEPTLDVAVPVLGISGLDNFVQPRPMNIRKGDWAATTNQADLVAGSGPFGYYVGSDFRAAYVPGVALNGAGQSVGLFELDGYFPGDIADYETLARLPNVPVTNILLDGFSGAAGSENIEVALDIDMAICMAPGLLQVMVYEGTVPNDILNRMATDNQAKQLSSSWGFYPQIDPVREQIYQQFAAQGQTMFQASGDSGAYAGAIFPPSDDPNLTVVGGTSLGTTGPGGAWAYEVAWSGSGGGISTTYSIPVWQQGINMAANHGSATMRNIPDVACLSDVLLWLIANNGEQGPVGGTSAAAPLWAGFAALMNQKAAANGQPSLGFLNPALYAIGQGPGYAAAFHDITAGNDTTSNSPTNFFATIGYDLCTGWGSPSGSNLINALVSPPDALSVMPVTNVILTGPAGGPFVMLGQGFVLTDIGTNVFGWALGGGASWLAPSVAGGALAPGGFPGTLTLGATPSAASLPAGSYNATLWFTNLGDGVAQSRAVTLDVVVPPFILQQPVNQNIPAGGTAAFSVVVAPNALVFYQWQYNGTNLSDGGNISGSSTGTLTISNVGVANVGGYQVVISNAAGVLVSAHAQLNIISSAPVVVSQPASQTVAQGAPAVFAVSAAGTAPLSYQWRLNSTNLTDGGGISGSSASALTISAAMPSSAGSYSVVLSNSLGTAISSNAMLGVNSFTTAGASISTLYTFSGGLDGGNPNGLVQHSNGDFYGTTQTGGTNNSGTIFQMTPAGAFSTLVLFSNAGTSPFVPLAALTEGADGFLYGTTAGGGAGSWGAVIKTDTNGVLTTLASLNGGGTGYSPAAALFQGSDGAFYGTANYGGAFQDGTAFRVTTNGSLTTLAAFNYADGAIPNELIQAADGNFYGTTFAGGQHGNGTIFRLSTNGNLASLASFNYTNGGSLPPAGVIQSPDGSFYGTAYEGGAYGYGDVYQMSPSGAVTTVYSFTGGSDGAHPSAGLVMGSDGNLYGTTFEGGAFQLGGVFRLSTTGALTPLLQFDGFDGANPAAPLTMGSDGNIYGTTIDGGTNDLGVVFRVNLNYPAVQITSQPASQDIFLGANAVFSVAVLGNGPIYYQWMKNGTNLVDGPGVSGSTNRVLTLANVSPASSGVYSVMVSNAASHVLSSSASLGVILSPPQITLQPASQTATVGSTVFFNASAVGDLPLGWQWQRNGTNLSDGGQVAGSSTSTLTISGVAETNDASYSVIVSNAIGATASQATVLTVFAPSVPGTTVAALHAFTGAADGGVPNELCQGSDGLLYGTTQNGGAYGLGTVFTLSTNGTLATLVSFNGTNGATPLGALVEGTNGLYYGTTKLGGSNAAGTIFSVAPNGSLNSIYSFASNNDSIDPFTVLTPDGLGNFLGASQNNAAANDGNIFRLGPDGSVATVHAFSGGADGTLPADAPVLGNDGNFYGATGSSQQSMSILGNIYRMNASGVVTNLHSFTGADGYSPAGQLALGDDGNFYGVTRFNYILFHGFHISLYGTVFKVTPGGTLTGLYSFNPTVVYTDGAFPVTGMLHASDGNFYGTTLQGLNLTVDGVTFNNSSGTVFRLTPSGAVTTLTAFNGADDGALPRTALMQGADGSLYGTTSTGGPGGQGTIYRIGFTSAPQITFQPLSQTNVIGGRAVFYVATFGAPFLSYQWQQNGTNLADGAGVSGSANRVLTLNNLAAAQAGTYSVIVTNALGSVSSTGAVLTLVAPPVFESVTQTGGMFSFTWSAALQGNYQVQYTLDLSSGAWTNLGGAVTATNTIMGASDTFSPTGQKFYRVVLAP